MFFSSIVGTFLAFVGSFFVQTPSPFSPLQRHVPTTPVSEAFLLQQAPFAEAHREFVAQFAAASAALPENVSLSDWTSEFVTQAMRIYSLPSAAVAIVDLSNNASLVNTTAFLRDENIVSARGNTAQLLFRIASITKSITATAIMMLVQEKRIASLDDAMNAYLDADLQYTTPLNNTQITLRHLLMHLGGFEEQTIAQIVPNDEDLLPLHDYLRRIRPPQRFPAGAVPAYSNFGFSLLGRVIERLTNASYEQFVRTRIFTPLGMNASVISPRDPLYVSIDYWNRLAPQLAPNPVDVKSAIGTTDLGPYVFQYVPAGEVLLTPDDMARYARFHLTGGQAPDGTQLVDAALIAEMHGSAASPLGVGYGFIKVQVGGNTTLFMHDGDMPSMSSRLLVIPSQQRAIFVSFGKGMVPLREQLTAEYGKQFAKAPFGGLKPSNDPSLRSDQAVVQGTFGATRRMFTGCLSFISRISAIELEAFAENSGTQVSFGAPYDNANLRYVNAVPGVYVQTINRLSMSVPDYLSFPYMFASTIDRKAEYLVLLDPLAGWYNADGETSGLNYLIIVLVSATFVLLTLACLLCSCCFHQCIKKNDRDSMLRAYTAKDVFRRGNNEEGVSLTASDRASTGKTSVWRTERMQHDVAVYCYTPALFIMLIVMVVTYYQTIAVIGESFPSVGAIVFFPFAFIICTSLGVMCALVTCARRHWWVDRRVLFTLVHLAFFAFAVVWGTVGGGFHDSCYNN